jgi:tetratricopeptide (TPR) repeat protein
VNPGAAARTFLEALVLLSRYERTGVMEVVADRVTTRVYILEGTPVFASEGAHSDAIGRVLLEEGLLDEAQYVDVLKHLVNGADGQLAEVACNLGYLTWDQVDAALSEQVRRKTLHCMQWEVTQQQFTESRGVLDDVPHFPVDVEPLVIEGARRYLSPAATQNILERVSDEYPLLIGSAAEVGDALQLKNAERKFLELLDGALSKDAVLLRSPLDQLHAQQLLAALSLLDEIEWHPEPQAAPAGDAASPRPTGAAPRAAPPAQGDRALPLRLRRLRQAILRRPSLPPPSVKAAPPPNDGKARLLAEVCFRRGRNALRNTMAGKALADLKRATELDPEAAEYALAHAWAEYQLAKDSKERGTQRVELERLIARALMENRELALAHNVQGHLFLAAGDEERAIRAFKRAFHFDSSDVDAERHLRVLTRRR